MTRASELTVIDAATIRAAMDLPTARAVVSSALIDSARGAAVAPDEMAMRLPHGGELHVKGAHLDGSPWIAFKVATGGFPAGGNSGGTMVVDAESGAPRAFLADGGWLTEIRTAAAAAIASATLAVEPVRRVAVLGTGAQARYQIDAHREALPGAELVVWGRTAAHAERLSREVDAEAAASLAAALDGADVVVTATSATEPFLLAGGVAPGVQITAVGADMPHKNEVDPALVRRADLIAADDVRVAARVGELHHAPEVVARAVDLGSIIAGERAGRTDPSAITLCDLCGLGVEDAAMAGLVLDRIDLD